MDVRAVEGECGNCGQEVRQGGVWLPLECSSCRRLFHLSCLKGKKPPAMRGDRLFHFTCANCNQLGQDMWSRPHLQWVHVIHLVLYNLMVTKDGKNGYFRWNEDICGYIQANWQGLMPHRRKTQSWHSTVAGTLSVHCPSLFQSGAKQLGENGWWSLTSVSPPDPSVALRTSKGEIKNSRSDGEDRPLCEPESKRIRIMDPPTLVETDYASSSSSTSSEFSVSPAFTFSHPSLSLLSPRQEIIILSFLSLLKNAARTNPMASRLYRKLRVRQQQRNHGYATFDLDVYTSRCLSSTVKYVVDKRKPYLEQIVPVTRKISSPSPPPSSPPPSSSSLLYHSLYQRVSLAPVLVQGRSGQAHHLSIVLGGRGSGGCRTLTPINSPYTARLLKPYIFRSTELSSLHTRLMAEIVSCYRKSHHDTPPYCPPSIDLCYLQREHVRPVNALLSHFFWPVDVTECLQYPDSTVVALCGQLVVGCGFMTPDVNVGEAYISFLLVHPHFAGVGLGKMMLYHLVQSCRGKDVALHVSVDNPAMLLYQSFGFKAERFCLDFYLRYHPPSHPHSNHAYFMRLWR